MKEILPRLNRVTTPERAYSQRYVIAIVVTLATILETLDNTVVNVAVPSMMGTLGATLDEIAWVTTGYAVANAIVVPVSSWLCDQFGQRNYFALCILLFTVASMLCGTATNITELVFWRLVQGLAGGGLIPTSTLILLDVYPAAEVGIGLAIWGAGFNLGPAIGPILGGWLTDNISWPWIFYINLPLGALALLLALLFVPNARKPAVPGKIDLPGLLMIAIAIGSAQAFIERGERQGWLESPEIVAYGLTFVVTLPILIWHELRTPHAVIDLGVFRNRQFVGTLLIVMVVGAAGYMGPLALPLFLQTMLGYTAYEAGFTQLPFILALMLAFGLTGKASSYPWLDQRLLIIPGLMILAYSMWLSAGLTLQSGDTDFVFMQVLRGMGLAMTMLPLTGLCIANLPAHQVGVGNSVFNLFRQFGGSIGVAAFTVLLEQRTRSSRDALATHISTLHGAAMERMEQLRQFFIAHGDPPGIAASRALHVLDDLVAGHAVMSAYNQTYMLFALAVLAALIPVLLLKTGHTVNRSTPAH